MRVVRWAEFKTLPQGTIYQEIEGGGLSSTLQILGGFSEHEGRIIDFTEANLLPLLEQHYTLGEDWMRGAGLDPEKAYVIHPTGYGRDGVYNHERRVWLVWEEADRKRLAAWLLDPEAAVDVQNDDPHASVVVEEADLAVRRR